MQLTQGYLDALSADVLGRYEVREVRNASRVLQSTDPQAWGEITGMLERFRLSAAHLLQPGGNEGLVARELNQAMREQGWREARVDTSVQHTLVMFPFRGAGESRTLTTRLEPQSWEGYKADWVKGRIAGDCEWNAKDGNLDRDFASYRSLYEAGFIDGAVLVTRTQDDLWRLETELIEELLAVGPARAAALTGASEDGYAQSIARVRDIRSKNGPGANVSRLATTTTTNLAKLVQRLTRGDGGGCPILVVAICDRTFDGVRLTGGTGPGAGAPGSADASATPGLGTTTEPPEDGVLPGLP